MKYMVLPVILIGTLFGSNSLFAQRKIESPKVVDIEQEGDSIFYREKEIIFEVLDFEFDSCNFYRNNYSLTFQLINRTKYTLFLNSNYVTWYDSNYLLANDLGFKMLKPEQSIWITLESFSYAKRRMNSPGKLLLLYHEKEVSIPIRLKQESSKIIPCAEGQKLIK